MRTLGLILLTAASYYIAGRLGLLLAIPPGYATAVWPASGLALAAILLWGYRVWPGILLGSFCVNVGTAFDATSIATILKSLVVASSIGLGASLQALVAAWLVHRLVGYRNILTQEFGAIRLLLLSGPLACCINATLAVTTLWLAGLVPSQNYLFHWWTWWVGDSIGVLIFTPLALVWALRPRRQWWRQQWMVTLPMLVMLAAVVSLFIFVSNREEARVQVEFEKWTSQFTHELGKDLSIYTALLDAVKGLYESSNSVEPAEFRHFTSRLLARHYDVQALSWNALVKQADRERFEQGMRDRGWQDYRIYEMNQANERVPAGMREIYFPITLSSPRERNRQSLGFDINSEAVRQAAIRQALASGSITATGPIRLVQFDGKSIGVLLLTPAYRGGESDGELLGLAVVVIHIADLMQSATRLLAGSGLQVSVYDETPASMPAFLYSTSGGMPLKHTDRDGLNESMLMEVAGRQWRLHFHLPASYLVANRTWQAWSLLAAGLALTAMLGIMLLLSVGHTARIESVVAERTEQLNHSNRELQKEIAEHARLQAEADHRSQELAEKNNELERFAYIVSHDLQAPLRSIAGFTDLLGRRYGDGFDEEGREFLKFIVDGALQMKRMIADILSLSRIGSGAIERKPVDMGELVDQILASIQIDIQQAGAEVAHEALPVVPGDRAQLQQLLQNLISNAIKFRPADRAPKINVRAARAGSGWHFEVADNGIGIPADQQEKLFGLFVRLPAAEEYPGTGLGLAICKRIVERHGGRIWIESEAGEGTTFHFVLPDMA